MHFPAVNFVQRSSVCSQNSEILKLCHGFGNKYGVFGREVMGNSGDDSVFEGFTGDNFIKVDGDLDIDFDALPSDNTNDSEASDEEGDTLLTLSTESWTRAQNVQEVNFI